MAALEAVGEGTKGVQHLRHLVEQLGLPGIDCPTPALNGNRGTVDWTDPGCKPTKKLGHGGLAGPGAAGAEQHGEACSCWIPGKTNPADIFTKEDNGIQHCCSLRDLMAMAREELVDDGTESRTVTPVEEANEQASKALSNKESGADDDTGLSNGATCRQSCVQWADIVKKG